MANDQKQKKVTFMAVATSPAKAILSGLRDFLIRFLLPLLGLGILLTVIEWGLNSMGVHGDIIHWLRMAVIPLYIVIAVMGTRKRKPEPAEPAE